MSATGGPRLQPLTRARVAGLGDAGRAWAEALPAVLDRLAAEWGLELGRGLPGGSASYVASATRAGQEPVEELVVKVPVPGIGTDDEAAVLAAADGRGYARLHARDPVSGALLLERLGDQLERTPWPPGRRLAVLAETLREAWTVDVAGLVPGPGPGPGPDKAEQLAVLVQDLDARLGHPVAPEVLRAALDHAERLAGWAGATVTVHGDPHPANTLRAPDGRGSGWVLVDPDGFRADPAYDAGVALRDWCSHLRGPDARARLRGWTGNLADRLDLDPERVWSWALLERVSTGLYVTSIGSPRVGAPYLETARALV